MHCALSAGSRHRLVGLSPVLIWVASLSRISVLVGPGACRLRNGLLIFVCVCSWFGIVIGQPCPNRRSFSSTATLEAARSSNRFVSYQNIARKFKCVYLYAFRC
jgi:hypothetical protein